MTGALFYTAISEISRRMIHLKSDQGLSKTLNRNIAGFLNIWSQSDLIRIVCFDCNMDYIFLNKIEVLY